MSNMKRIYITWKKILKCLYGENTRLTMHFPISFY